MAVCVGDTVRFLNEVGGGKVTRIKNETAYVLIDEGFEIPVAVSQLVIINKDAAPNNSPLEEKQILSQEKKQNTYFQISYNYTERESESFDEYNERPKLTLNKQNNSDKIIEKSKNKIFIAFGIESSTKNGEDGINLYLINDSDFNLLYSVGIREGKKHALLDAGEVESFEKVFISKISKESYPDLKSITVQAIKFKKGIFETESLVDEELKIRSLKLLTNNTFKENEYFDFPAWLILLESNFTRDEKEKSILNISEILTEKETIEPDISKRFKKPPEPVLVEIDLHINQLVDDIRGMSNSEMLEVQLSKFRAELEKAIREKVNKIVFIHGIGNGTLKLNIRKQLDKLYPHLQYHDASFKEYGYGATLVILR